MTLNQAISTLRRLEIEAQEKWPFGFNSVKVASEAGAAILVIGRHVHSLPEAERTRETARIVKLIEGPEPPKPPKPAPAEQGTLV